MSKLLAFLFVAFLYSCSSKEKEISIDKNTRAVGNISSDSVFNGLIKFYEVPSGVLLFTSTYKNGILEGEKIDYYKSGKVYSKQYYNAGKLNGAALFYDEKGNIDFTQYYYYGLSMGPKIHFKEEEIKSYDFYSLENKLLFSVDYDSLKESKLSEIEEDFFFFNSIDFRYVGDSLFPKRREYFLYLPNPPKLKFEYNLVKIDSDFNVISTEKNLTDTKTAWTVFELEKNENSQFALQLLIKDSVNQANYTMFKRLDGLATDEVN